MYPFEKITKDNLVDYLHNTDVHHWYFSGTVNGQQLMVRLPKEEFTVHTYDDVKYQWTGIPNDGTREVMAYRIRLACGLESN